MQTYNVIIRNRKRPHQGVYLSPGFLVSLFLFDCEIQEVILLWCAQLMVVQLVGMLGLRLLIFHFLLVCYHSHKDFIVFCLGYINSLIGTRHHRFIEETILIWLNGADYRINL
ncbi:hypothetical protein NC653_002360 [Populus alba x Populus x berolinensis]|uniref:Uncharacterized protein n=1 Tax=Populus alba x Populus x berolinensis TaxID=444605 RepID=A0AAD6RNS8_9ROSI|nr:hypothetical protein NC653_002360 [Populus alba x Populus x berolinensis]